MELECDFVLASGALGNIVKGNFESSQASDVETQHRAGELGRSPVPPLHTQLLLQHIQRVGLLEELGDLVLFLQKC